MIRLEPVLVALFLVCWLMDALALLGVVRLAGSLQVGLYPLFILAAASGWLLGNIYLRRSAALPPGIRRRIFVIYFLGPLGLLYLVWTMAPLDLQREAPLAPLYSFAVFTIFFLVPLSLRSAFAPRQDFKIGRRPPQE